MSRYQPPALPMLPGQRYEARSGTTMWGPKVILWDTATNQKAESSKRGPHVWPLTKAGWAEAAQTALHISAEVPE